MRRPIAICVGVLLFAAGVGIAFISSRQARIRSNIVVANGDGTIRITDDGFIPRYLQVPAGSRVVFVNERDSDVWPASNPHPLHTIYPEFDSKRAVAPGESWAFVPQRSGVWRYHDHLFPSSGGKLFVSDPTTGAVPEGECDDLSALQQFEKEYCWDRLLSDAFEEGGITRAFALFTKLYKTDAQFAVSGCHAYAHRIGDSFYGQVAKRSDISTLSLPKETVYCGYGFYHGLFEHLFRDNPDPQLAKSLCDQLGKKFSGNIPRIRLNCFHGVGHGFVQQPNDKGLWSNPQAIIDPALAVCDGISANSYEVRECLQGSFNVIADWIWRGEYGLTVDKDNPMQLCREQKTRAYTLACYYELSMHLSSPRLTGAQLVDAVRLYADPINDDQAAQIVVGSMAAGLMQGMVALKDDFSEYIDACYRLDTRLRTECISGIAGGFVAHGEPGREYIKALSFCGSALLTEFDRQFCHKTMLRTFRGAYTKKKVADICTMIDQKYREYCDYSKYPEL